ncbi:MAG: cell division protein FtsZ [Rhodothermales bacterium]
MENIISSRFAFDDDASEGPKIAVIGVGGGGGNAINNMVAKGINGVDFISINTDKQALDVNRAEVKIQAGVSLTKGLGAGARPVKGAEAVEESRSEIEQLLRGYEMVFITAGMGGGTGTGGAPVVSAIARKLGILTVAIVTKPFECEGRRRMESAGAGIELLREQVDTLIIIPNERLLDIAEPHTSMIEAFEKADDVLLNATRGISDLITVHGLINLDFADVETTMKNGGTALMGAATASGENRAERAAIEAISSPLLDGVSIAGARNALVNITAGRNLGIHEATTATSIIQREAGDDVEVIFGTVIDEDMGDSLRVTVIATGFDKQRKPSAGPAAPQRRSSPLEQENTVNYPNYKGEDNLRQLDIPAFERRQPGPPRMANPIELSDDADAANRIKRLQSDDVRERRERIGKGNTDVPAFLRKMID